MRRHRELTFGAELVREGVRFRLWAPQAKSAAVRLEDPGELPPAPQPSPHGTGRQPGQPGPARLTARRPLAMDTHNP